MSAENELIVVFCTAPEEATAERLANGLVEARLAACVNVIPRVRSYYRWQGKIENDSEVQLIIKTQRDRFDELATWIQANHPYDVPEVVAVAAERASDAYLQWVIKESS